MEYFFKIQNCSEFKSLQPSFQLHTLTHCAEPLAETLLARRLDRGEKIYDRKNANRCSPFGRDPGRGNAWEPNRRI